MEVVYSRCCGLDVHKKSVVACVLTPEGRQTRTFGTMTRDLLALADWLTQERITHVAMESTGVYWQPVFNVLEESFTVWVVNAFSVKTVQAERPMSKMRSGWRTCCGTGWCGPATSQSVPSESCGNWCATGAA